MFLPWQKGSRHKSEDAQSRLQPIFAPCLGVVNQSKVSSVVNLNRYTGNTKQSERVVPKRQQVITTFSVVPTMFS
jgi:hypothetical protein